MRLPEEVLGAPPKAPVTGSIRFLGFFSVLLRGLPVKEKIIRALHGLSSVP